MMPTTSEDVKAITGRLYALGVAILAKTGERPWHGPQIGIKDDQCEITLYGSLFRANAFFYAKGETPCAALDAAESFAASMPDLATSHLHNHMKGVAALIDTGRAAGIDEVYLAPLAATVAAISANLLPSPAAHEIPMKESA